MTRTTRIVRSSKSSVPTGAKSGEPRTRPTSIPVEGGPIYVFAGYSGALTNPVVLQKNKLIKIRVRCVVEEAFLDKRCAPFAFFTSIRFSSMHHFDELKFFCNTTI